MKSAYQLATGCGFPWDPQAQDLLPWSPLRPQPAALEKGPVFPSPRLRQRKN